VKAIKVVAWDDQTWARRLFIGGAVVGIASFGGESAGIAAMGTAVGVPLALISTVGATILGVLIDETKKEKANR
jgi:hypothetical protein